MSRLTADSNRSPIVPATTRTAPSTSASQISRNSPRSWYSAKKQTSRDAATPAKKPSHVLPGDMIAASLWRPISRPAKYAAVSAAQTASRTVKIASRPK